MPKLAVSFMQWYSLMDLRLFEAGTEECAGHFVHILTMNEGGIEVSWDSVFHAVLDLTTF